MKTTTLFVAAIALLSVPSWAATSSEAAHEAASRVQAAGKLAPVMDGKTDSGEACQIDLSANGDSVLAEVSLTSTNEVPQLQLSDDPNFVIDTFESNPNQLVVKYHDHEPGGLGHSDWGMPIPRLPSTKSWSLSISFHANKITAVEVEADGDALKCNLGR